MKRILITILLLILPGIKPLAGEYLDPEFPYAPVAGVEGSTAIHFTDEAILSWAAGVESFEIGDGSEEAAFQNPGNVIGPSTGGGADVLVLGRGGQATLLFEPAIRNGDGPDLAVFENAFSNTFLELAYVEVSSDGIHFVRFPSYSLTSGPVGTWGQVDATFIHGLAGKYRAGYGTPFDLQVLVDARTALEQGFTGFSPAYAQHLEETFPFLDVEAVRYVRIVDIAGDGSAPDCQGFPVYDPYPTFITAGFDLDAVAALNVAGQLQSFHWWATEAGLSGDPGEDADADGWADLLEYHFATVPTDPGSVPSFDARRTGDQLYLEFRIPAHTEGDLTVLAGGSGLEWTESLVEKGPEGTDGFIDCRVAIGPADRFCRFIASPPEDVLRRADQAK